MALPSRLAYFREAAPTAYIKRSPATSKLALTPTPTGAEKSLNPKRIQKVHVRTQTRVMFFSVDERRSAKGINAPLGIPFDIFFFQGRALESGKGLKSAWAR